MILYRKTFPLKKGLSFQNYLHALAEKNFSPYALVLEKIFSDHCRAEIVFAYPIPPLGWVSTFFGDAFFNQCQISYIKDRNEISLEAYTKVLNLFVVLLMGLLATFFVLVVFYLHLTQGISINDLFAALIILAVVLAPYVLTYTRERKLLERIGSLAFESD